MDALELVMEHRHAHERVEPAGLVVRMGLLQIVAHQPGDLISLLRRRGNHRAAFLISQHGAGQGAQANAAFQQGGLNGEHVVEPQETLLAHAGEAELQRGGVAVHLPAARMENWAVVASP